MQKSFQKALKEGLSGPVENRSGVVREAIDGRAGWFAGHSTFMWRLFSVFQGDSAVFHNTVSVILSTENLFSFLIFYSFVLALFVSLSVNVFVNSSIRYVVC